VDTITNFKFIILRYTLNVEVSIALLPSPDVSSLHEQKFQFLNPRSQLLTSTCFERVLDTEYARSAGSADIPS